MAQRRLMIESTLAVLDIVKARFSDQPQVYIQFLDVLMSSIEQAISFEHRMELVTTRLGNLFKGNPDVITILNDTIMPYGYKIEVPEDRTDEDDDIDR